MRVRWRASEDFPRVDVTSREHGMYQLAQRGRLPWSENSSPRSYGLERLNKPVKRPLSVFEAIDQDRTLTGEATAGEFHAVGHGTSIIRVWGKDLLDGSVFIRTVIAPQPCELDLDGPFRDGSEGQVAYIAAAWITALSRIRISVPVGCLHLRDGHRHRSVLAERADSRLVKPGRIAVAGRLRAAMIDSFHGEGEVTNDLVKIHGPEVTALPGPRLLNPRIKSSSAILEAV